MDEMCLPRDQLERWFRGESVSGDRLRVTRHVDSCPVCRETLERIVEVAELAAIARRSTESAPGAAVHGEEAPQPAPQPLVGYDTDPNTEITREFLFRHGVVLPEAPVSCPAAGKTFGRFQLLERIGVGGFGVVYRAFDTMLQREVALKLPRGLAVADDDTRLRFLREARAAAALRHPHIVPIYDAGEIEEQCYLTAAYCPGETLSAWRKRQEGGRVPAHTAAEVVRQLAGAISHAHESGILHRDVKPDNVLLDPARPSDELPFTLMLTDFGLAKVIASEATQTAGGLALGTARYMAPEQARPDLAEVGPGVDIYALGVILYELLTGRAPIQGENDVDTLVRVATDLPPSPARFVEELPRDLGAICLMCLEKDPADRYATARDLDADLQRFLAGESTLARPLRTWEIGLRAMRRHRTVTALGLTLLGSLAVLAAGFALRAQELERHGRELQALAERLENQLHERNRARLEAEESRRLAEQRGENLAQMLYATGIRLAARAWREGDARERDERLQDQVPGESDVDRRDFSWQFLSGFARPSSAQVQVSDQPLYAAVVAPNSNALVVAGHDGWIRVLDPRTLAIRIEVDSGQKEVNGVSFAASGRLVASAGADGSLRVWDFPDLRPVLSIPDAHTDQAFHCVFIDHDRVLASCGLRDGVVRLWDIADGDAAGTLEGHSGTIESLLTLDQGRSLASLGADGDVRLWDVESRALLRTLTGHKDRVSSACCVGGGKTLMTAGLDGRLCTWDVDSGRLLDTRFLVDALQVLVPAADGALILAGDRSGILTLCGLASKPDQALSVAAASSQASPPEDVPGATPLVRPDDDDPPVWPADSPATVNRWPAHAGRVYALATTADGQCFSVGEDGFVRRWSSALHSPVSEWRSPGGRPIDDIAEVSSAREVVVLDDAGVLHEAADGTCESARPPVGGNSPWRRLCVAPDGETLMGVDAGGTLWRLSPGDEAPQKMGALPTGSIPTEIQFSPGGRELLAIDFGKNAVVRLSADFGETLQALTLRDPRDVEWSRNASVAAIASLNDVVLLHPGRPDPLVRVASHQGAANCVAWHPAGKLIASGGQDRTVLITDVAQRQPVATLQGHRAGVTAAAFSPDGRCLATADVQGTIKLWHTATWQYLYDLTTTGEQCYKLSFSPDGDRLTAQFGQHVLVFSPHVDMTGMARD